MIALDDVEIKFVVEADCCVELLVDGNWVASIELPVTVISCCAVEPKEGDKEVIVASVVSDVNPEVIV